MEPVKEVAKDIVGGKIPSTQAVAATLDVAKQSLETSKQTMDPTGKKLIDDTQTLIEDAKKFVEEKKSLEKLGTLMEHSKAAAQEVTKTLPDWNQIESKAKQEAYESLGKEATDALNLAKNVSFNVVKSRAFRQLLIDIIDLVQGLIQGGMESIPAFGETLKADIAKGDTNLSKTTNAAKKLSDKVTTGTQQVVSKVQEGTVPLPKYDKERISKEFNAIINTIASNKDYKELVNAVFRILDHFQERAQKLKEVKFNPAESDAFTKVWNDVKGIVESFTGEGSLTSVSKRTSTLFTELWNDQWALSFFRDLKQFIMDALANPASLNTDAVKHKFDQLSDRFIALGQTHQYQRRMNDILNELRYLLTRITEEPLVQKLADDSSKLAQDLILDASGRPSLMKLQQSMGQIRNLVVPLITQQLQKIPIPKIHGSTPKYDYWLDNVIFGTKELMPEKIYLKFADFAEVTTRQMSVSKTVAYLLLQVSDINIELRDIGFHFKRKTFPQLEDTGVMDVFVAGEDTRIVIRWKVESEEGSPFIFTLDAIDCHIQKMKINFKQAHHDWLLAIAAKLFMTNIKRSIEEYVEDSLRGGVGTINFKLNQISREGFDAQQLMSDATSSLQQGAKTVVDTVLSNPEVKQTVEMAKQAIPDSVKDKAEQMLPESVKQTAQQVADKLATSK